MQNMNKLRPKFDKNQNFIDRTMVNTLKDADFDFEIDNYVHIWINIYIHIYIYV